MSTFPDFVGWAGTQKAAGDLLGLSGPMVSLILSGQRPLLPEYAIKAEEASGGLFSCEQLLPEVEFIRTEEGVRWFADKKQKTG